MWLECLVEETYDRGRKTRTTEARAKRRGITQGSTWNFATFSRAERGNQKTQEFVSLVQVAHRDLSQ
jgi:hypothetical protein